MTSEADTASVERICAWSGVVLLVAFLTVFVFVCDLWPPTDPSWSAAEVKQFFSEDVTAKRVGIAICLAAWALMLPWGAALAAQTARSESGFKILSIIQVVDAATTVVIGELMLLLWGVNLFRPETFGAESMQQFNDLAWFIFVMYWAPGTVWVWAVGAAVLRDRGKLPVFPRWVGWFNVWVGFTFFPACLGLFFKDGPFAYNGVFTVWLPASVFFAWYAVMTYMMLRAIRERQHRLSTL